MKAFISGGIVGAAIGYLVNDTARGALTGACIGVVVIFVMTLIFAISNKK
jgi:hypothetical protein